MMFNNWFPVSHALLEDEKFKKYSTTVKLVYMWFFKLSNRLAIKEGEMKGFFFRSTKLLSQDTGVSERGVWSAKKLLKNDGKISIKPGKYYPEKNKRHASWIKVNGLFNKEKAGPDNQQVVSQDGIIIKAAIENKFHKLKGLFELLIEFDCLEQISDSQARLKASEDDIKVILSRRFPNDYFAISKYLERFRKLNEGM